MTLLTACSLALEFTLRTTSVSNSPIEMHPLSSRTTPNPYILPFALRGLLEEEVVRTTLSQEVNRLLEQYEHWTPATKGLRDIKYRL